VIIEKLKAATGPDRELDGLIWEATTTDKMYWSIHRHFNGDCCLRYYPGPPGPEDSPLLRYTSSIDAALTLVPANHWWSLLSGEDEDGVMTPPSAIVAPFEKFAPSCEIYPGATPAIALCIAALEARRRA